jgi:hypothetical protein
VGTRKWFASALLAVSAVLPGCGQDDGPTSTSASQLAGTYTLVRINGAAFTVEERSTFRDSDGSSCVVRTTDRTLTFRTVRTYTYITHEQDNCDDSRQFQNRTNELTGSFQISGNQLLLEGLGIFGFDLQGDTLFLVFVLLQPPLVWELTR